MEKFVPDPIEKAETLDELLAFVKREHERIAIALEGVFPTQPEELHKEPTRKIDRMVVFADGTHWNPGAGRGLYIWLDGAWKAITAVPVVEPPPQDPDPPVDPEDPEEPGPLPPEQGTAVMTFHSAGLYWTPPTPPAGDGCVLEYRKTGDVTWIRAHDMWYDSRNNECRGSVVYLDSNTQYDFQFSLVFGSPIGSTQGRTWNETFPIGETVNLPASSSSMLNITSGGTAAGYKLYTFGGGGSATIDVANGAAHCIQISAPFVIIRGLTLKGAQQHGIRLFTGAHDIVIEQCDISDWGRESPGMTATLATPGWRAGVNSDSAIFVYEVSTLRRLIVQNCKIHDPRYGTNPWDKGHPLGPNGIFLDDSGANHVFRYNEFYSNPANHYHYFMDAMGGAENFSAAGYPGPDSDIYGNYIWGCMDDAIEAEGGGKNVRVWGNYMDRCATGVATTVVQTGPIYIFRNVMNRCRFYFFTRTWDTDSRSYFAKAATVGSWGRGRRYVYHNTLLQAPPESGFVQTMGCGSAITGLGGGANPAQPLNNTISRNNIWHIWKNHWAAIHPVGGTDNDIDYDLTNGVIEGPSGANMLNGVPTYKVGHGAIAEGTGKYQLLSGSGLNDGQVLRNFSDNMLGGAPDRGAHENGTADLVFGVLGSGPGPGAP